MPVSRRLLHHAIAARLLATATTGVGYYTLVGRALPGSGPVPSDPPAKSSSDPRVVPYYVLAPGAGGTTTDLDVGGRHEGIDIPVAVTVAAGDPDDLLALVDRIDAALHGWRPAGTGWLAGPLRRPPGYEAPVLVDDTVSPERPYVPLQYVTTVHTT